MPLTGNGEVRSWHREKELPTSGESRRESETEGCTPVLGSHPSPSPGEFPVATVTSQAAQRQKFLLTVLEAGSPGENLAFSGFPWLPQCGIPHPPGQRPISLCSVWPPRGHPTLCRVLVTSAPPGHMVTARAHVGDPGVGLPLRTLFPVRPYLQLPECDLDVFGGPFWPTTSTLKLCELR